MSKAMFLIIIVLLFLLHIIEICEWSSLHPYVYVERDDGRSDSDWFLDPSDPLSPLNPISPIPWPEPFKNN